MNKSIPSGIGNSGRLAQKRTGGAGNSREEQEIARLKSLNLRLNLQNENLRESYGKLTDSYERLLDLYNNSPAAIITLGGNGEILSANETAIERFQAHREDFIGSKLSAYIAEEDKEEFSYFKKKLEHSSSGHSCDIRLKTKHGGRVYVKACGKSVPGVDSGFELRLAFSDNTLSKITENELRENERKYRSLIEGLNDAVFRMSLPGGRLEYVSPSISEVFGHPIEKFYASGSTFIEKAICPEMKSHFKEAWQELLQGEIPKTYEYEVIDADGKRRWILQSNRGIYDSGGNLAGLEGLCRNITNLKETERKLIESEEKFRAIANYTYDWEAWISPEGKFLWSNPSVKRITGYTSEECFSMRDFPYCIIDDEFQAEARASLSSAIKNQSSGNDIPIRIVTKGGAKCWLSVCWQPINSAAGEYLGLRASARDITKRIETRETLMRLIEGLRVSNEAIKSKNFKLGELKEKYHSARDKYNGFRSGNAHFLAQLSEELVKSFLGFNTIHKALSEGLNEDNHQRAREVSAQALDLIRKTINRVESYIKNQSPTD